MASAFTWSVYVEQGREIKGQRVIVVELKTIFSFEGREIDEYPLNGTETPGWPVHTLLEQTWEALSDLRNDTPRWLEELGTPSHDRLGEGKCLRALRNFTADLELSISAVAAECVTSLNQPLAGAMTCDRSLATTLRNSARLIRRVTPLSWSICQRKKWFNLFMVCASHFRAPPRSLSL